MLLSSHRHTPDDLRLWAEHEAADRQLANGIGWREAAAIDELCRFAMTGTCYVCTSWGKDSVVLCSLLAMSGLRLPVVNLRVDPTRNPYCDSVRDVVLRRYSLEYHEINVSYRDCGQWFSVDWERETFARWRAGWREVQSRFGERHISGVRAAESSKREKRMRFFGLSSQFTCAPIGHWSTELVFAFLARHDLPVHPNYAMLGGGRYDRSRIRVAELGDLVGNGMGRTAHEREYYGDVLRRIEAS